jgi:hypothetical protein
MKVRYFSLEVFLLFHQKFFCIVYTDESALIAKNTSLIVARVPVAGATNKKFW